MGEGIAHIMSPLSAPWCGWTMLVLLLFAVLSEWLQPGVIAQSPVSILVRAERTYKEAPTSVMAQILITLFRIGTLAMLICLYCCESGSFPFMAFMAVSGIILGVLIAKMLCNVLLDYTFQLSRQFGEIYEHYSNLLTLTVVALYPVLLLFLHIGSAASYRWLLIITGGVFLLLWLFRSAQQYIRTPMAILYLLVYTLTLEVLPMAGLIYLSAKTISYI